MFWAQTRTCDTTLGSQDSSAYASTHSQSTTPTLSILHTVTATRVVHARHIIHVLLHPHALYVCMSALDIELSKSQPTYCTSVWRWGCRRDPSLRDRRDLLRLWMWRWLYRSQQILWWTPGSGRSYPAKVGGIEKGERQREQSTQKPYHAPLYTTTTVYTLCRPRPGVHCWKWCPINHA